MSRRLFWTTVVRAVTLAVAASALGACGKASKGPGLKFYDQTLPPFIDPHFHPIAAGATTQVEVFEGQSQAKLKTVRSAQPNVLTVTWFNGDMFGLHAGAPGRSRISATTPTTNGAVNLTVEPIATSLLTIQGWTTGLETYLSQGFALGPGVDIGFHVEHFDANGTLLTGEGAQPVSASPSSSLSAAPSENFHLTAPSTPGATIDLHAAGKDFQVEVVDPTQVASLDLLINPASGGEAQPEPSNFSVVAGSYQAAMPSPRLSDGRVLLAPCTDLKVTQVSGSATVQADFGLLKMTPQDMLLSFPKVGTVTFSFQCLGLTRTYNATIVAAPKQ